MNCRVLLLFILLLTTHAVISQDFSNKGKDFWIAYPSHIDGVASVMGIYITSDVNATGTIQVGPSGTINFTVTANQVTRKFLGSSGVVDATNAYVLVTQQDGVKTNAAIHIISDKPVVVYTHIIRSARSGACLALPTPVLGLEYIAPSNASTGGNAGADAQGVGEITVVATQPNTVIEVTPTVAGRAGKPANVPFQVTLPLAGDVYQFQGVQNADISGTRVRSISSAGTAGCKAVAVFSATTWSAFDCTAASGGDNLFQELFPLRTWGKKFITAPFINRPYDVYRIFVNDATTKVTVTNNGVTSQLTGGTFNANGKFYSISTSNPLYIDCDKPISVVQYIVSQTCKTGCSTNSNNPACFADPEMVLLNPIEQTLSDITFFSAHQSYVPAGQTQITQHYVNVIIDKNYKNTVKIDNALPNGTFIDIAGTNYSFLQENVSASSAANPVHNIKADTSFSAIVYGYGQVESYGYNGGTNIKDLYQYVTLQNQYAAINFPATCRNTPFNFSITLPYKATSLTWDFNNNALLTPNATVVNNTPVPDSTFVRDSRTLYLYKLPGIYRFKTIGTYSIKVFADNPTADGCTGIQEINYDVEVYDPPIANWVQNFSGCLGDSLRITDSSKGSGRQIVKWLWDFGDNTIDSVKNPVKQFKTADSFNVSLNVITDIGCIADTIKKVIVSPLPGSKFGVAGSFCPSGNITFSDSSAIASGNIVKWYWNFGNGNAITATSNINQVQAYPAAGTYTVTLQVESGNGCRSTVFSRAITINPKPLVNFDLPGVCLPSGVAIFKNLSSLGNGGALTYLWSFGDGQNDTATNPRHVYTNPGPYNINLQATSVVGCARDTTINFTNIFAKPRADFTASAVQICVTDSIRFSDKSIAANNTVTQWFWQFGDGTTSNIQSPVKRYLAGGSYAVQLYIISAAGCVSDTLTLTVKIDSLPAAQFNTSSPLCAGKAVSFTDQSRANSGLITSRFWDYGDGTSAAKTTGDSYEKTYAATGTYQVKLALTTDKGCKSDTAYTTVVVNPQPTANFLLPAVCLNDAFAQFTDSSFVSAGILTYQWNFGDPLAGPGDPFISSLKDPRHKYSTVGDYNVFLQVTSSGGCIDTLTKVFTVNGAIPKSNFVVLNSQSLCSNTQVSIQNKSTVNFGIITRLEIYWDKLASPALADVDVATQPDKSYTHKYPSLQTDKNYLVTVRAFSGGACVDESSQTITVRASPLVTIAPNAAICLEASPRQIASPANGAVAGSGVWSGAGISPQGIFSPGGRTAGTDSIKYLYTSITGCKDSAMSSIRLLPSPVAAFNFSAITCARNDISFTDASVANVGKVTRWVWNFGLTGDSVLNTGNAFNYQYAQPANYNVRLQVFTDSGCQSTLLTKAVTVHPLPVVNFSLPSVCLPGGNGQFFDSSVISNATESQFKYTWNFGDPADATPSSVKNPVHRFSTTGPFAVKLIVTSANGCLDSLSKQLSTVYPQPKAAFTFTPTDTCAGGIFYFTDGSTGLSSAVINWFWNLGDGTSSSLQNPVKKLTTAGTYNVSLYIKNQQNCLSDTVSKQVILHPYPSANAGPDLFVLEGGNALIKATASGNGLQYLWSPVLYLNNSTALTPVTSPQADITYKLTVIGTGNCIAEDAVFIKVLRSLGVPNAFSPNGDGINDKWLIEYLESYPGATVEVFNRYGQQVFYSLGYPQPWNGSFKGSPLPVGVYYYIINPKNGRKPYTGSVTILK